MNGLSARIQRILRAQSLTQKELADRAGIDQSSVSRMVRHPRLRSGSAYRKLLDLMQQYESEEVPPRALEALQGTWDRSDDHDRALEQLILASQAFRPKMEE